MRRGLMAWSQDELPPATLERRVAALLDGMDADGLDALLVYTNFTRPDAVHWLTGFTPYWNQGVLVLTRAAGAVFVCALSQRVADWMRSVSRLDDVICTQQIGRGIAQQIGGDSAARRVGVVDLDGFPGHMLNLIREAGAAVTFVDAADLFARTRAAEVPTNDRLAETLVAIAEKAMQAAAAAAAETSSANAIIAAAERVCRLAGAEELLPTLAPDLAHDPRLRRIEGGGEVGNRFALQLSVAYKGVWVRYGRTLSRDGMGAIGAEPWAATLLSAIDLGEPADAIARRAATSIGRNAQEFWRIEGPIGGAPLGILAGSAPYRATDPLPRGLLSLSLRARTPNGWEFLAQPIIRGRQTASQ